MDHGKWKFSTICSRLSINNWVKVNIEMGGTGKTPFSIWLAQELEVMGLKGTILTRGYKRKYTKDNT